MYVFGPVLVCMYVQYVFTFLITVEGQDQVLDTEANAEYESGSDL